MRSALAIVPFLAACGGSARSSSEGPGNTAAPAPTPCPSAAELVTIALDVWAPAKDPVELWCQAVHVQGEARWFLAGYASPPRGDGYAPHFALVSPSGGAVWTDAGRFDELHPTGSDAKAADLDGDGADEVIYVETMGDGGVSFAVVVVGIAGGQPRFGRADLGWQNEEEGCRGEWKVTEGRVVITAEGNCATYTGRYRWDGSTLVTE